MQILVPGDICVIAPQFIKPELAIRGCTYPWFVSDIPEDRPADNRFIVIDQLNTRQDHAFAVDVLTQFRIHDPEDRRCKRVAQLVNGLAEMLPSGLEVQWAEHAGGPTELPDPDLPGVRRYLVTWWLTVPCQVA